MLLSVLRDVLCLKTAREREMRARDQRLWPAAASAEQKKRFKDTEAASHHSHCELEPANLIQLGHETR